MTILKNLRNLPLHTVIPFCQKTVISFVKMLILLVIEHFNSRVTNFTGVTKFTG